MNTNKYCKQITNKWGDFLRKTPKYIKESPEFNKIRRKIWEDVNAMEHLFNYTKTSLVGFNINVNENLTDLFHLKSHGRGKVIGKGEILLTFLIDEYKLSGVNCFDIKDGADDPFEVKNHPNKKNSMSLGVIATASGTDFGSYLNNLLHLISLRGRDDEKFRKEHPFWFEIYKRSNSYHNGKYMVDKFLNNEIPRVTGFGVFIDEITKLKGKIDHRYTNNIDDYINDIIDVNREMSKKVNNLLIWVDGEYYGENTDIFISEITQSKFKFTLQQKISMVKGLSLGVEKKVSQLTKEIL
jgi:hypothetical protein